MNRFIFLSEQFYQAYPINLYPEIEQKHERPYIYIATLIGNTQFAVPLRSDINHRHVLWTDKPNHCGIDFSKAVVITKPEYIDDKRTPHIRPKEFKALLGKEYIISQKMVSYIAQYKKAKSKPNI